MAPARWRSQAATEISNLALEGSAVLSNGGTITQNGNWYLGYNASDTSQLVNSGRCQLHDRQQFQHLWRCRRKADQRRHPGQEGWRRFPQIREATTNTGTITVTSGTLSFGGGTNSFGGSVGGAGELELYAGTDTFAQAWR